MGHLEEIKQVIALERDTIDALLDSVDSSWEEAVQMILQAPRKLILSGMGKSGHIATKIAATLSSTGTPAVFLHPSESLHGDLGLVESGDLLIFFSKSGESDEMIAMLPSLKKLNCRMIAVTANRQSTLANHADLVLYTPVAKEACSLNLAPTCSTTSSLVVGDALAVALMQAKGFQPEEFALFHPAGRLGKRLLFQVSDLMRKGDDNPVTAINDSFEVVLNAIGKGGVNGVNVVDDQGNLVGLITGFDLRKAFGEHENLKGLTAKDIMVSSPQTVDPDCFAVKCLEQMNSTTKPVNLMPVVDQGKSVGMITLSDMVRAGL